MPRRFIKEDLIGMSPSFQTPAAALVRKSMLNVSTVTPLEKTHRSKTKSKSHKRTRSAKTPKLSAKKFNSTKKLKQANSSKKLDPDTRSLHHKF